MMKTHALSACIALVTIVGSVADEGAGWQPLFKDDLSNANFSKGVWTRDAAGILTASEDQSIWSEKDYENFELQLEFKTAPGTNSGVIIYCSDTKGWIPNSVEIQIADDHAKAWASKPKTWQCGAIFGRLAAERRVVKKPGDWNTMKVVARGPKITVAINGDTVTKMDMRKWTSAKVNPDGSDIPSWLNKPLATLPTKGKIGFQGKHAGAPIFFRNIEIREIPPQSEE